MPSVGMRRTTRIFGTRVLRSGRQLWTGPDEPKKIKLVGRGSWIELLDNSDHHGKDANGYKEKGLCGADVGLKQEVAGMDIDKNLHGCKSEKCKSDNNVKSMCGSVYRRKRKRTDTKSADMLGVNKTKMIVEDRKYGKHFFRKQWRKRIKESPMAESCESKVGSVQLEGSVMSRALVATVKSTCSSTARFVFLLASILRYMRRARIRLSQLSTFLLSEPIAHVYSSCGIQFKRGLPCAKTVGVCHILGVRSCIPLFTVDFAAVPYCFEHLHSSLHLRLAVLSYPLIFLRSVSLIDDRTTNEELAFDDDQCGNKKVVSGNPRQSCFEHDKSGNRTVTSGNDNPVNRRVSHPTVATPRRSCRVMQLRNGVNSRCIQRMRSSLRSRRGRNSSMFGARRVNGSLASDPISVRHANFPLCPSSSSSKSRSSVQRRSTTDIKELRSTLLDLTQDLDFASCSSNLLIIESDRCYREVGVVIVLELSVASKQWFLAIKLGGATRYTLMAQKNMRPCSCNRFTHAIIWSGDKGWKLEFPSRRDWLIFKELYRECSDRNAQALTVCIIPVPIACEESCYANCSDVPFARPKSYITVKDDEVSRALARHTANYDLDSDDEEWIDKFNNESTEKNKQVMLSAESFESIVDAFEKGFYCTPEDYSDEERAVNLCLDLGRSEVLGAVYSYWMKKRKQKGSALARIFQCYQPRRAQVIPKSVFRKKRSFKRQARPGGKGKHLTFLQEDASEEKNNIIKVQGAKAAASRSEGVAVFKRQRAQLLREKADLAIYKATMAMRIAEAAQVAKSSDVAVSCFLG